jgi:hypothetical protein
MSSRSIKWIRAGVVLMSLWGINPQAVLADSIQHTNEKISPPSYLDTGINQNNQFLGGEIQQTSREKDERATDLSIKEQSVVYLPVIINGHCFNPYVDDFSDPGSGWPIVDEADYQLEYINGEYRILVKNTERWGTASAGFKASDYLVTVDVHNANEAYGSYGIVFQLADDWSTYYTFEIFSDGYYSVWRYDAKKSGWKSLEFKFSAHINQGTAHNQIQLVRSGVLIQGFANGQLIVELEDDSFTGLGALGLIATTYADEADVDARFDNFSVEPYQCSTP